MDTRELNGKLNTTFNLVAVAAVAVLIGAALATLVNTLFLSGDDPPFTPITVSEVTVNSRVNGVDGPAVHVGEPWNGTVEICNSDDEPQTITFVIQVEKLGGPMRFVDLDPVDFPKEPGCETFTGDSAPLPEEVTPGLWRESSSAVVQRGDQKQTVSFVSEPFEVLP